MTDFGRRNRCKALSAPALALALFASLLVATSATTPVHAAGLPVVTLALGADTITEGGSTTVTATLSETSTAETTIVVSVDPTDTTTLSTNTTLTIAVGNTSSTGTVTIAASDDSTYTGKRTVTVSGAASNTAGVDGPDDLTLTITDDERDNHRRPFLSVHHPPTITDKTLTLTFDEDLKESGVPPADRFTVKVNGRKRAVESVTVSDAVVTLTVAEATIEGDSVTVGYTAPGRGSAHDRHHPERLQNPSGEQVRNFTDQAVTTASGPCPATVEDSFWEACLTFGRRHPRLGWNPGSGMGGLSRTSFTRDSTDYEVTFMFELLWDFPGRNLFALGFEDDPNPAAKNWTLVLGDTELDFQDGVYAHGSYRWPNSMVDWDDVAAGDKMTVALKLTAASDEAPPKALSGTVNGATLELTFDEELKSGSVPAESAFAVTVEESTRSLASTDPVTISGETLTLTLASAVNHDEEVTVTYTKPGSDPLRDAADNDVLDFEREITNTTPNPHLRSLVLDPLELTLAEDGTTTYRVKLDKEPSQNVVVRIWPTSDMPNYAVSARGPKKVSISPTRVTLTTSNWNTGAVVTVNGKYHRSAGNQHTTLHHCGRLLRGTAFQCGSLYYAGKAELPVTVTNTASDPVLAKRVPSQRARTGQLYSYTVPANTFHDAEGDTLHYQAGRWVTHNYYGKLNVMPDWLSFNTSTRTFSGTPQAGDVGNYLLWVTANDRGPGLSAAAWFLLTVHEDSSSSPSSSLRQTRSPGQADRLTGLKARGYDDRVELTWDVAARATTYRVLRRPQGEGNYRHVGTSTTNSYTDTEVTAGVVYDYRVTAVQGTRTGASSEVTSGLTLPPSPEPPANLQASVDGTSVTLSWESADDDTVTGYVVARRVRDADPPEQFVSVAELDADTLTVTDTGLSPATAYEYHVLALNLGGHSEPATTEATTAAETSTPSTAPAAPAGLGAGTVTRTGVALSWDAVAGAANYRVEYRQETATEWTAASDAVNGTSHTVTGLVCGSSYRFRVSAYGDGTAHTADWGEASDELTGATAACNAAPEFGSSSYSFSIAEDAAVGDTVGTVSASDGDNDSLTYTIESGDSDGKFAISSSGAVTVAAALDFESAPSHALTVQADDGNGATATATVAITVTDVVEDPDATRDGAVSLGDQSPSKGRQFFRNKSLDRANGDAVDYYTFTTTGRYQLGLGVRDQSIDLLAYLEDADGNQVGVSAPPLDPNKDQTIEWLKITLEPGTHYIRVEATEDGSTRYYLRLKLSLVPPAAPAGLGAGTVTRTGVALSWDAVAGAANYRVEYRQETATEWTAASDAVNGTSHTVTGLVCGSSYRFQVSAYGDGTAHTADWGEASDELTAATAACNAAPEFGSSSYSFSIAEDAAVGDTVGTVSASDGDNDSLTYTIESGNSDGKFAISSSGAVTVAAALEFESAPSHALTVQADDGNGATATATVAITVTDVVEDPDATRDGAVSLGDQSPSKGRQFFRNKSLDRANGDAVDYYTFTTTGRYELGLGARGQSIELKVTLEDADGNVVGTAGPPLDPNKDQLYIEWLRITIDAGTYYVRVEALEDDATGYYIRFALE